MSSLFYSIIIPHYNNPDKLDRLLQSIPPREDMQVIVVDDCSSSDQDRYFEIKNKHNNVEFYSTSSNGGGGLARNIGLKKARGKYLIFADSDDYFLTEFDNVLTSFRKSEEIIDIQFNNAISVFENSFQPSQRCKNLNKYFKLLPLRRNRAEKFFRFQFGEPWGKIIRKQLLEDYHIRFDETKIHNDTNFSNKCGIFAQNLSFNSIPIYCVTDSNGSVSKGINYDNLRIRAEVFSEKEDYLSTHGIHYKDPITFTPLIIGILNRKIKFINSIIPIYKSKRFSNFQIIYRCFETSIYYLFNKFKSLFKYLNLK